jgi:hypothetical protein
MNSENQLKEYLKVWKQIYADRMDSGEFDTEHLSDETLYRAAEHGGIEKAESEAIAHLSLCPICMERWAAWRETVSALEEDEIEEPPVMSYGFLRAAATHERGPIQSESSCGRFILGLLPEVGAVEKGLITLDVIKEDDTSLEGRYMTVRDRNGRLFLEGRIHRGRLARRCENLTDIDLSNWTVIETNK